MSGNKHYPYGKPVISGLVKSQVDDFVVTENLGFEPGGEGEHLFLWIEKSMLSTHCLIDRVAKDFCVKARDIGYCGLKDKVALTRQWLSLYLPGQMKRFEPPATSGYKLIDWAWHHKKLRPGTHRANHFEVIIRNVETVPEASWRQLDLIRTQGMANYFGRQRFGRQNNNVEQALHTFNHPRRARRLSRNKKSLYISALRSFLFNGILSRRIEQGYWKLPVPGDVFMLSGSQSIFYEQINNLLLERYYQFDLSSTISLYGIGKRMLKLKALELEDEVLLKNEAIEQCLIHQKAKLQMRATRVVAQDLSVNHDPVESTLHIRVTLPRGSFFTSLLDHFVDAGHS